MKAMILAAGLGTRLRPLTDKTPKALVEVGGRSLLEWNLLRLKATKIQEVVINIHHHADQVIKFLEKKENFGLSIHLSDEREQLLETGGGLKKAGPWLRGKEPFLLLNVDVLTDLDLIAMAEFHDRYKPLATLAVRHRDSSRKLLFDDSGRLSGWRNLQSGQDRIVRPKATPFKEMAFSGIHIIDPQIFSFLDREGPFSIIDSYLKLAAHHPVLAYAHDADNWLDVGRPQALELAAELVQDWESGLLKSV